MPAQPITFTYPTKKSCTINIDFEGHEYRILWDGDWRKPPDLSQFPLVERATVTLIKHNSNVHRLWMSSQVLSHGADSHIRVLNSCTDEFPICKVAINDQQRSLLQEEYSIIRYLSSKDVPVVRTHPEPLTNEQGIFGFRMERLFDIDKNDAVKYIPEIEKAFDVIHRSGIVHYDISPSNLLLNHKRSITIIDFGRAGYIGEKIPSYKTKGIKPTKSDIFSVESDMYAMQETFSMFITPVNTPFRISLCLEIFSRKGCFT